MIKTIKGINVDNLSVWFYSNNSRFDAVKSASLNVPRGESHGLVGESGSGKSTILRAIVGLVSSYSGDISVLGDNLTTHKRKNDFYKSVQMVFQDPYASLHPRKTVDHVLSETLNLHSFKSVDSRIIKTLDSVGLGKVCRFRYPHQLSGGQRQRIAIARAVITKPSVLLLDEPTSALDVSVQAEILNLLSDLRDLYKLTYLMVSHDLAVVQHMCSSISVMNSGEIVENLSVDNLRKMKASHPYTKQLISASVSYS